jgi:hypothetical protein
MGTETTFVDLEAITDVEISEFLVASCYEMSDGNEESITQVRISVFDKQLIVYALATYNTSKTKIC